MSIDKSDFVRAQAHCDVTPGEAIRMVRELQELSQQNLADLSGFSQSNISALENNSTNLGRERALILAKVLHVHPAVLLFPDFNMSQVA